MSFFTYALGAVLLIFVLLRQVRAVPVPRVYHPRLPVFLGVIGLLELTSYVGDHHVSSSAWLWVLASLAVGAVGLGALRGLSMRVWTTNGWVVRQGNAVTMALWLVSLVVQFAAGSANNHAGADGPRSGELPPLSGSDPRRAVLRGVPPRRAPLGAARAERGQAAAGAIHPGAGCLLRHLPCRGRRPARMGTRRRGRRGAVRSQRDRCGGRGGRRTTAHPSCTRRADRFYTRRP